MGGSLPFRIGHAGAKHRKRASDSAFFFHLVVP